MQKFFSQENGWGAERWGGNEGKEGGDAEWEYLADFDYLLAKLKLFILSISHQRSCFCAPLLSLCAPPLLFVLNSSWNRAHWREMCKTEQTERGLCASNVIRWRCEKHVQEKDLKWTKRLGDVSPLRLEEEKEGRARKKERRAERELGGESGSKAWSGWKNTGEGSLLDFLPHARTFSTKKHETFMRITLFFFYTFWIFVDLGPSCFI